MHINLKHNVRLQFAALTGHSSLWWKKGTSYYLDKVKGSQIFWCPSNLTALYVIWWQENGWSFSLDFYGFFSLCMDSLWLVLLIILWMHRPFKLSIACYDCIKKYFVAVHLQSHTRTKGQTDQTTNAVNEGEHILWHLTITCIVYTFYNSLTAN